MKISGWRWPPTFIWSLLVGSILLFAGDSLAQLTADFLETYWRVLEIDGTPVKVSPPAREPHIIFKADGRRVHGSTGCNRFTGSFVKTADSLRCQQLATTRMACPPPAAGLEKSFLQAIAAVRRYHLAGNRLELQDEQGKTRLLLEAQYLR